MNFIKALLSLTNIVAATIFSGFVFSTLWAWFIVTTFGLPPITLVAALGVILVVRYLTVRTKISDLDEDNAVKYEEWIKPAVTLVLGFVIKQFM